MGCKLPSHKMQKKGAEAGAGTKAKYCKVAETGHRGEPGMLVSGTKRRRSLCWRVLDHLMRRTVPYEENFVSATEVAGRVKAESKATVRLDLRRKEKKATVRLDLRRKEKKATVKPTASTRQ